jgi:exosortase
MIVPDVVAAPRARIAWVTLAWFSVLILVCYAPVLIALVNNWYVDADMGHGFFVPLVSGLIIWQRKEELAAIKPKPNLWGLVLILFGAIMVIVGTLGVELFISRNAFIITLIGAIWLLRGTETLKKVAFPIFLLFFMVPIPNLLYARLTFPLQILASQSASVALDFLGIPVLREGNVLELPNGPLSVVEACSGIRSLLSLTFLSLAYGYFFEKSTWIRVTLFLATIPIAIVANAARVTATGIMAQIKPELGEGFFHESTGWVIFLAALAMLILFHQALLRIVRLRQRIREVRKEERAAQ